MLSNNVNESLIIWAQPAITISLQSINCVGINMEKKYNTFLAKLF